VIDEDILGAAAGWAGAYVAPLGRRWKHVQAVASKAARVARTFNSDDARLLVAAAWLHDIGYAGDLAMSGFHPLDGGRFVRTCGVEDRVAMLVANHSGARVEAELRGIEGYADELPFIDDGLDAALTYCDLTTGPDGHEMSLHERLA
jgi:putative nucleotidyltransferase with HDIG domain